MHQRATNSLFLIGLVKKNQRFWHQLDYEENDLLDFQQQLYSETREQQNDNLSHLGEKINR